MFKAGIEAPVVSLRIHLPILPVNFYNGNLLRSISGNVGKVLKIDLAALQVAFAMAATIIGELICGNLFLNVYGLGLVVMVFCNFLNT